MGSIISTEFTRICLRIAYIVNYNTISMYVITCQGNN